MIFCLNNAYITHIPGVRYATAAHTSTQVTLRPCKSAGDILQNSRNKLVIIM